MNRRRLSEAGGVQLHLFRPSGCGRFMIAPRLNQGWKHIVETCRGKQNFGAARRPAPRRKTKAGRAEFSLADINPRDIVRIGMGENEVRL